MAVARAGYYTIENATIRFGRDGRWYADGEPITNVRIAALFARHLRRAPGGNYFLEIGSERTPVDVEDTPYVVVGATVDGAGTVRIELNDSSTEDLALPSLHVGAGDVLYCRVKGGRERARFLRPAYYQLAPHIAEASPGCFVLRAGGVAHRIERA